MKIGVIADLQLEQLASYYEAARNIFENVRLVKSKADLKGIDAVLCGNDHFQPHRDIWENDEFIEEVNQLSIPFFAHTVEHIDSKVFPWNLKIQANLNKFSKLRQRCWDVNDAKKYGTKLARVLISENYLKNYEPCRNKSRKAVFIGKIYPERAKLLEKVQKYIKVDTIPRLEISYRTFLSILASYKFIFSPLSISSTGLPGRFYEALAVGSCPIQQVANETLGAYSLEASFQDAIFFKDIKEVGDKANNHHLTETANVMTLEEELKGFFNDYS